MKKYIIIVAMILLGASTASCDRKPYAQRMADNIHFIWAHNACWAASAGLRYRGGISLVPDYFCEVDIGRKRQEIGLKIYDPRIELW